MRFGKRKALHWRIELAIAFAAVIFLIPFLLLGRFDLALPSLLSVGMIAFAVYSNWKLRRFWWFWASIALICVLHLYLIPRSPWVAENLSSIVVVTIGLADLGLIVGLIKLVELICRDREESNAIRRSQ